MTATMSDADLRAEVERMAEDGRPSRNQIMRALGVGASRAARLLASLDTAPPAVEHTPERIDVIDGIHARTKSEPVRPAEVAPEPVRPEPATAAPGPVEQPAGPVTEPEADRDQSASPVEQSEAVRSRPRGVQIAVVLIALPAAVAIWSGWVGLGGLTGFGPVHLLPGIADQWTVNSAITLPIGVEAYAALALRVWLGGGRSARVARFAKGSAIGSLCLGALGQIAYHLMTAAKVTAAPWWITTLVACLPVVTLGMASALLHLTQTDKEADQ